MKKEFIRSLILFFIFTSIIFWPSFIKGQVLFPGNYMQAWFEPYKSANSSNGMLLISHKPVADDVFRHIYPFKTLSVDMLRNFQLPLWNPYNGAGQPLLATVNSGLIDPFNLLFFILPYILAWNSYLFLQLFLVGFCTYWYCRSLKWHPLASIFAGVSFSLSGVVIARVTLGAYGLGIAVLPFLLWIIESYVTNPKTKRLFLIPPAIFALITSTHPQIGLFVLLFTSIYLVVKALSLNLKNKLQFFLFPAFFIFLGILLSAIQLLPTAELLRYGNVTTATSSYIQKFLVPYYHLVSIIIPNYFGNAATYNFWGGPDYVESLIAIGSLPCFLAYIFVAFGKKSSVKLLFLGTFLVTCLVAVDSPISQFILKLPIPIISTDPPPRIFLLTAFSIAILGGGGIEILLNKKWSLLQSLKNSLPFLFLVGFIVGITFYLYRTIPLCPQGIVATCHQIALRNTLLELGVFIVGFCLFLALAFFKNKNRKFLISGLIVCIFVIGFYNAEKFLPFSPQSTIFPNTSFFQKLESIRDEGRVFGFSNATIAVNFATYFRIYDPQYYHPLYIRRYGELTAYANYGIYNYDVLRSDVVIRNDLKPNPTEEARRERLLSLLNTTGLIYNVQEKPLVPRQNALWLDKNNYLIHQNALQRAFVVTHVQTQPDSKKLLETLFNPQFDPSKEAIVEKKITLNKQPIQSTIAITSYQENKVIINTQTNQPSLLVLLDNYYPGWNAYIDGKQITVYRTDYTFRGISLPKGKHTVTFIYQPQSVQMGLLISLATVVILIFSFFGYTKLINNTK